MSQSIVELNLLCCQHSILKPAKKRLTLLYTQIGRPLYDRLPIPTTRRKRPQNPRIGGRRPRFLASKRPTLDGQPHCNEPLKPVSEKLAKFRPRATPCQFRPASKPPVGH